MIRQLFLLSGILCASVCCAQSPSAWLIHDLNRPRPPIVNPAPQNLPVPPPSDAKILFNGSDLRHWRAKNGEAARWIVRDGYMESVPKSGYLFTADSFGDVQLHLEWASPNPPSGVGQHRGNSGVLLMGKYEVQILDSYQSDTYADGQAASIYGQHPPLANVCLPPGEWQSYDIHFRRPRFDSNGIVLSPARMTVIHNGVLVQDAQELLGPTSWLQYAKYEKHPDRLPLALQDHGNPIRFRNIWLRELPETKSAPDKQTALQRDNLLKVDHFDRYIGLYETPSGLQFEVTASESSMLFRLVDRHRIELVSLREGEFQLRWTAAEVRFGLDETGLARNLQLEVGGRKYDAVRVND